MIGPMLGHYKITAALSKTGLGEVYRASRIGRGGESGSSSHSGLFKRDASALARLKRVKP